MKVYILIFGVESIVGGPPSFAEANEAPQFTILRLGDASLPSFSMHAQISSSSDLYIGSRFQNTTHRRLMANAFASVNPGSTYPA